MATACSVRPYAGPLLGLLMTRDALVGLPKNGVCVVVTGEETGEMGLSSNLVGVKGRPSVAEAGLSARPAESKSESESESESRASSPACDEVLQ